MNTNFNKVLKMLDDNNFDCLILYTEMNRFWLSGKKTSEGLIIIDKKKSTYYVDARDYDEVKNITTVSKVVKIDSWSEIPNIIAENYGNNIAFEDSMSYKAYERLLLPANKHFTSFNMQELRATKNTEEIAAIRKACELAADCEDWIRSQLFVGITEKETAVKIYSYFVDKGASALSFGSIVCFGANGGIPHHEPDDTRLQLNDMVTIDMGCIYNDYCSDITRSFCFGEPNEKQKNMWQLVYDAQKLGLETVSSKLTGAAVDKVCRDFIAKHEEFGTLFCHGTGHGVGLEIHEFPNVNRFYNKPLPVGSIVTIEPGVYQAGFGGIRIEDTVLITEDGCEILTAKSPKVI